MEHSIPVPPPLPNNMVVESRTNVTNANNSNNTSNNSGSTSGKIRIHRSALEQAEWYGLPDEAFEFMTEEEIDADMKSFNAMIEFERKSSNWW